MEYLFHFDMSSGPIDNGTYHKHPFPYGCNVCTPQAESTPRNLEAGSAYRLSPQSPVSKEAQNKLWGITTHIQAKGSKFP